MSEASASEAVYRMEGYSPLSFEESVSAAEVGSYGERIIKKRKRGDFVAVDFLEGGPLSVEEKIARIDRSSRLRQIDSFAVPELVRIDGDTVESEFVDGLNMRDAIERSDEEAYRIGKLFGRKLEEAHRSGMAFREFNLGNFVLENHELFGENLYYVDRETFTTDATAMDRYADLFLLANRSADFNSEERYHSFLEGFCEDYSIEEPKMESALLAGAAGYLFMKEPSKSARNLSWVADRYLG